MSHNEVHMDQTYPSSSNRCRTCPSHINLQNLSQIFTNWCKLKFTHVAFQSLKWVATCALTKAKLIWGAKAVKRAKLRGWVVIIFVKETKSQLRNTLGVKTAIEPIFLLHDKTSLADNLFFLFTWLSLYCSKTFVSLELDL